MNKVCAIASVVFDDAFVVHDLRIVNGDKGLFVAMPSRKLPNGEFRDVCHPINSSTRAAIQAGEIIHDANPTLTEQVLMATAYTSRDGHAQLSQRASEGPIYLARALVWAVGYELRPNQRRKHLVAVAS